MTQLRPVPLFTLTSELFVVLRFSADWVIALGWEPLFSQNGSLKNSACENSVRPVRLHISVGEWARGGRWDRPLLERQVAPFLGNRY